MFRSSKHIYAQLIDDLDGRHAGRGQQRRGKDVPSVHVRRQHQGRAKSSARSWPRSAKAKGITKAAFDRGHYRYHGRIKALADAAREGGLQF